MRTIIKDTTIVTMNDHMEVVKGDILWESKAADGSPGRILQIGGQIQPEPFDQVIDGSGSAVIPGFVQTHIHLCQVLLRNNADDMVLIDWLKKRVWPYEASLDPDSLRTSARLGLAELVLGGTTTLLDMGTVNHTESIVEAIQESGIRAFFGKCQMDYGDEVPKAMLENTAASMKEAIALAERWDGAENGRIRYAFAPRFAVSCTESLMRQIVEAARDLDVYIHTHASETEFENEYTREHHGVSNMAYLESIGICGAKTVLAHGVHVSDEDCELLKRTDTAICHCPSANLKLASGIANIPRYDQFGIRVGLGADGAPCNNNLDAFVEMRLAALLQKPIHGPTAMPAERVLRLATRDGARVLGIDDQVGSLEVGKCADVVMIELDNDPGTNPGGSVYSRIVYAAHRANVRHVFASGNQVVKDRELLTQDVPKMLHEARSAIKTVLGRMEA
jgi:5-methylthioadenosine/S-adenosylhomocysteine deaminase